MSTLETEVVKQKSNILDIFQNNKEYYCVKFKVADMENKLYMGGIMFFEISDDNEIKIFTAEFMDKPRLIFTKYNSIFDKLDIKNNWYDFYNQIAKQTEQALHSYFFFYTQILRKLKKQYYEGKFETKKAPGKGVEERKHLLFELKNDLYGYLVKIWSLYRTQVLVSTERINLTLLKHYRKEIEKQEREQEILEYGEEHDVDWGLKRGTPIKRYLPVISIEQGKLAKAIEPGDKVFVCDYISEEDLPHFPYKDRPEFEREVIDIQFDEKNSMRVLVKDTQGNYGDLEVFDTLFKVKTLKVEEEELPKRKWFNSSFWFFFNLFFMVIVLTIIYVLAKVSIL